MDLSLGTAAILFVLCLAGGILTLRFWRRQRRVALLAAWIALFILSAAFALYGAMALILIGAV